VSEAGTLHREPTPRLQVEDAVALMNSMNSTSPTNNTTHIEILPSHARTDGWFVAVRLPWASDKILRLPSGSGQHYADARFRERCDADGAFMIVFRSRYLRTGEIWFDEDPSDEPVDVLLYMHRPEPVASAKCQESPTLLVDLKQDAEVLLAAMPKDTRYEIRRAADKDKVVSLQSGTACTDLLPAFFEFYDRFASMKSIPLAPRTRLAKLAGAGALELTRATDPDGKDLVWHAYFRGARRVRLLHSGSVFRDSDDKDFRNLVGRANRCLHWQDMLYFKQRGIVAYDFGGWYVGDSHEDFLRVNQFKREFGGKVEQGYICHQVLTAKARLAFRVVRMLGKTK